MSAFALDRFTLGELDRDRAESVKEHLATCPACARALAAIEHERASFAAQPDQIKARVDALLARAGRALATEAHPAPLRFTAGWLLRIRRFLLVPAGAAAIAATLFFVIFRQAPDGGETAGLRDQHTDTSSFGALNRTKGDFSLGAYVQPRDSQAEGLPYSGELLVPGDRLRFSVSSTRAGYLAVIAVDMTGRASIYYPPSEGSEARAVALAPGTTLLPNAIELDAVLGAETIIALRCEEAVPVQRLVTAAQDAANQARAARRTPPELGALATGCAEARLHIQKRAASESTSDARPASRQVGD